jgi:hypothetical protein
MALRFGQMMLAVVGMWLVLARGLVRHPGWGDATGVPVHWAVDPMPLVGGILCIVLALGLIWARDSA